MTQLAISVAGILLLSACQKHSKFDLVAAGASAYRIDHETGETQVIDGTVLLPVLPSNAASAAKPKSQATYWPASNISQLAGLSIRARTVYREGKLQYVVVASPFKGAISTAFNQPFSGASFEMNLSDPDGFALGSAKLQVKGNGLRVVDEKGAPEAMQWTGSVAMSREAYDQIAMIDFSWSDFPNSIAPAASEPQ